MITSILPTLEGIVDCSICGSDDDPGLVIEFEGGELDGSSVAYCHACVGAAVYTYGEACRASHRRLHDLARALGAGSDEIV